MAEKALRNKTAFPSPPILKIKASPESLQAERAWPRLSKLWVFSLAFRPFLYPDCIEILHGC